MLCEWGVPVDKKRKKKPKFKRRDTTASTASKTSTVVSKKSRKATESIGNYAAADGGTTSAATVVPEAGEQAPRPSQPDGEQQTGSSGRGPVDVEQGPSLTPETAAARGKQSVSTDEAGNHANADARTTACPSTTTTVQEPESGSKLSASSSFNTLYNNTSLVIPEEEEVEPVPLSRQAVQHQCASTEEEAQRQQMQIAGENIIEANDPTTLPPVGIIVGNLPATASSSSSSSASSTASSPITAIQHESGLRFCEVDAKRQRQRIPFQHAAKTNSNFISDVNKSSIGGLDNDNWNSGCAATKGAAPVTSGGRSAASSRSASACCRNKNSQDTIILAGSSSSSDDEVQKSLEILRNLKSALDHDIQQQDHAVLHDQQLQRGESSSFTSREENEMSNDILSASSVSPSPSVDFDFLEVANINLIQNYNEDDGELFSAGSSSSRPPPAMSMKARFEGNLELLNGFDDEFIVENFEPSATVADGLMKNVEIYSHAKSTKTATGSTSVASSSSSSTSAANSATSSTTVSPLEESAPPSGSSVSTSVVPSVEQVPSSSSSSSSSVSKATSPFVALLDEHQQERDRAPSIEEVTSDADKDVTNRVEKSDEHLLAAIADSLAKDVAEHGVREEVESLYCSTDQNEDYQQLNTDLLFDEGAAGSGNSNFYPEAAPSTSRTEDTKKRNQREHVNLSEGRGNKNPGARPAGTRKSRSSRSSRPWYLPSTHLQWLADKAEDIFAQEHEIADRTSAIQIANGNASGPPRRGAPPEQEFLSYYENHWHNSSSSSYNYPESVLLERKPYVLFAPRCGFCKKFMCNPEIIDAVNVNVNQEQQQGQGCSAVEDEDEEVLFPFVAKSDEFLADIMPRISEHEGLGEREDEQKEQEESSSATNLAPEPPTVDVQPQQPAAPAPPTPRACSKTCIETNGKCQDLECNGVDMDDLPNRTELLSFEIERVHPATLTAEGAEEVCEDAGDEAGEAARKEKQNESFRTARTMTRTERIHYVLVWPHRNRNSAFGLKATSNSFHSSFTSTSTGGMEIASPRTDDDEEGDQPEEKYSKQKQSEYPLTLFLPGTGNINWQVPGCPWSGGFELLTNKNKLFNSFYIMPLIEDYRLESDMVYIEDSYGHYRYCEKTIELLLKHAVQHIEANAAINYNCYLDYEKFYLTGISMGGTGCWQILAHCGKYFAACVPIVGNPDWGVTGKRMDLNFGVYGLTVGYNEEDFLDPAEVDTARTGIAVAPTSSGVVDGANIATGGATGVEPAIVLAQHPHNKPEPDPFGFDAESLPDDDADPEVAKIVEKLRSRSSSKCTNISCVDELETDCHADTHGAAPSDCLDHNASERNWSNLVGKLVASFSSSATASEAAVSGTSSSSTSTRSKNLFTTSSGSVTTTSLSGPISIFEQTLAALAEIFLSRLLQGTGRGRRGPRSSGDQSASSEDDHVGGDSSRPQSTDAHVATSVAVAPGENHEESTGRGRPPNDPNNKHSNSNSALLSCFEAAAATTKLPINTLVHQIQEDGVTVVIQKSVRALLAKLQKENRNRARTSKSGVEKETNFVEQQQSYYQRAAPLIPPLPPKNYWPYEVDLQEDDSTCAEKENVNTKPLSFEENFQYCGIYQINVKNDVRICRPQRQHVERDMWFLANAQHKLPVPPEKDLYEDSTGELPGMLPAPATSSSSSSFAGGREDGSSPTHADLLVGAPSSVLPEGPEAANDEASRRPAGRDHRKSLKYWKRSFRTPTEAEKPNCLKYTFLEIQEDPMEDWPDWPDQHCVWFRAYQYEEWEVYKFLAQHRLPTEKAAGNKQELLRDSIAMGCGVVVE